MHPAAALVVENARTNSTLLAPLLLVLFSAAANLHAPVQHQLLVDCVSWSLLWVLGAFQAGLPWHNTEKKRTPGWLTGGFLALAAVCDRAACDREGIWTTRGLVPLFVVLLSDNPLLCKYTTLPSYTPPPELTVENAPVPDRTQSTSFRLLAVTVVAATIVLASNFTSPTTFALGLSSAIFTATALVIVESASKATKDDSSGRAGPVSANGSFSRRLPNQDLHKDHCMALLRDMAAIMTLACGVAVFLMEPRLRPERSDGAPLPHGLPKGWKELQQHRTFQQVVLMVFVTGVINFLIFSMASGPVLSLVRANTIQDRPAGRTAYIIPVSCFRHGRQIGRIALFRWDMVHRHLRDVHRSVLI